MASQRNLVNNDLSKINIDVEVVLSNEALFGEFY